MSRFGRWLDRARTPSSNSLNLSAEAQNMDVALTAAEKIMNDDIQGAQEELSHGDSAFHKLARGTLGFMKATLGFEPEVMKEASDLLAEAENSAYNFEHKAKHDSSAFSSAIYERGAEFALCQAEAQIMSAIVGVLNESLTESIRGFYKMRKAYMTLDNLIQQEQTFMKAREVKSLNNSRRTSKESLKSVESSHSAKEIPQLQTHPNKPSALRVAVTPGNEPGSPDSDDFQDAEEWKEKKTVADTYQGHTTQERNVVSETSPRLTEGMKALEIGQNSQVASPTDSQHSLTAASRPDLSRTATSNSKFGLINIEADSDVFKNSLDIFIHSGTNLMFGVISLMISVIPPAFARLLSIIGFRGNREKGMLMLWQASKFSNINGGMAALVLFGWYNGLIGFCDIYSDPDPSTPPMDQYEGYPIDRLHALLAEMRQRYPQSHLWMIEEARMAAARRDIDTALQLLEKAGVSEMKQLQALHMFERSLCSMHSHRYELCAASFLECVDLNGWSQALYYYIAAAAYLHKSRELSDSGDEVKAKKFEILAEETFKKAPSFVGKKKMMGRQLPFDAFVQRKIQKWEAQATAWKCSFLEAIGVAPIEEMILLWNGYKKMNESQLKVSLANLERSEKSPYWSKQGIDEKCVLNLLRSTIHRNLKEHEKAKEILVKEIYPHERHEFNGIHMDNWAPPTAYYEYAVNCWQQRSEYIRRYGSTLAGPSADPEKMPVHELKADALLVAEAKKHVEKAKSWGSYELDARIGMKVTAAGAAIEKWQVKNGFKTV